MLSIPSWLPILVTLLGMSGAGGVAVAFYRIGTGHAERQRKQTDDAVMAANDLLTKQNDALTKRLDAMDAAWKAESRACEQSVEALRHELRNVETQIDGLLDLLTYAPKAKHAEIIANARAKREEQRARKAATIGELRNSVQTAVSAERVKKDVADLAGK